MSTPVHNYNNAMHLGSNLKNIFLRHSIKAVVFVFVFSAIGGISFVQAQGITGGIGAPAIFIPQAVNPCPTGSTADNFIGGSNCKDSSGKIVGTFSANTGTYTPADANTNQSWETWFANQISGIIYVFTVGLGTLVAYVAGYFFNFAIYLSLNSTAYALEFITTGWQLVRDLANMAFIFILIYLAVTVTLKAETGKTIEALVRVVVVALIINFSFFFVRVVIDGGNILAIQFYNSIQAPLFNDSLKDQGGVINTAGNVASVLTNSSKDAKDLTAGLMGAINVDKILSTKSFQNFASENTGLKGFFVQAIALSFIYICVGVIFGLLAAMFFTIGIKFVSRVVILWLVIISAPLALVMYAVNTNMSKGFAKQWQDALITYSVYPAIFLFLFYIIVQFANGLAGCEANAAHTCNILSTAFDVSNDSEAKGLGYLVGLIGNIGIRLGFVMMLLYLATQASDTVSKWGGALAGKISSRPDKFAAGLSGLATRWTSIIPRNLSTNAPRAAGALISRPISGIGLDLDRSLKRSRWANQEGLGGVIGTTLRNNVAQPLSKTSFGKAKTMDAVEKQWKGDATEREANRKVRDARNTTDTLSTKIAANVASGKAIVLEKEEAATIRGINETRMKELSAQQIKTLANVFSEDQMKIVDKLEKLSEKDREDARKIWSDKAAGGPLRKMDKQIEILKDLKAQLHNLGMSMPKMDEHTKSKTVLTNVEFKEMREEIEDKLDAVKVAAAERTISPADKLVLEKSRTRLTKQLNELKTLEEAVKPLPPGEAVVK